MAGLLLAAAAAGTAVTATPASAVCQFYINGRCENVCTLAGRPYAIADDATGGKYLPTMYCAA